jgi:hypothetical protein
MRVPMLLVVLIFILELDVELEVVLEELPDSYVVAPPVYPPSILVLEPDIFVCVSAG